MKQTINEIIEAATAEIGCLPDPWKQAKLLMRAAPDLLEACKTALGLVGHACDCPRRENMDSECDCEFVKIRTAIAKAEGR